MVRRVRKFKTCRAVEANTGVRAAYAKTLLKVKRDFTAYILDELLLGAYDAGFFRAEYAMDAVMPKGKTRAERIKLIKGRILKAGSAYQQGNLKKFFDNYIAKHRGEWLRLLATGTNAAVERFVRRAAASTASAQKQALKAAGFDADLIKRQWTVPVVAGQYVAPEMAQRIPELVRDNAALITHINEGDIDRIAETMMTHLSAGGDYNSLLNTLRQTDGFNEARARRVALDQTIKINRQTQTLNALSLGITHAVWKHVPGQYTSRQSHIHFDGQEFDMRRGLFDPEVQDWVVPGQLPFCRCIQRLVIKETDNG